MTTPWEPHGTLRGDKELADARAECVRLRAELAEAKAEAALNEEGWRRELAELRTAAQVAMDELSVFRFGYVGRAMDALNAVGIRPAPGLPQGFDPTAVLDVAAGVLERGNQ